MPLLSCIKEKDIHYIIHNVLSNIENILVKVPHLLTMNISHKNCLNIYKMLHKILEIYT